MLPEFGLFALILALACAICQATIPFYGVWTNRPRLIAFARSAALAQFFCLSVAFLALLYAFIQNDFSVAYVANNSNAQLPFFYRSSAVWGAHEGSMLLWVCILSIWTVAVAFFSRDLPDSIRAQILGILGLISVGFLFFILTTSNPFLRVFPAISPTHSDLNPLLQDPGLAFHPPNLYMGYVGYAVTFAFAIVALLEGQLEKTWCQWARPWCLLAWCFLTLGIVMGSWWSYRVLGWGGWWAWDPVENASLLPWLAGTALMHSMLVTEKRAGFRGWTSLLAITCFSLSLFGTFLVRSGVLTSVHAFAVDPKRGLFMLVFLGIVVGCSLLLFAIRAHRFDAQPIEFRLLSRETLLLSNNVLLFVLMLTVLLGTIYPLLIDALNAGKISVGPPYFNAVFIPLFLPLLVLIGIAPTVYWQAMSCRTLLQKCRWPLLLTLISGLFFVSCTSLRQHPMSLIACTLALWIIFATLNQGWQKYREHRMKKHSLSRRFLGMLTAHLGLGVCALGVTLNVTYSLNRDVSLALGENVPLGNYVFLFDKITPIIGPNYQGAEVELRVSPKSGQTEAQTTTSQIISNSILIYAQKRIYHATQIALSQAGIHISPWRDLYVALGEPQEKTRWTMRLYVEPFVRWIWLGGLMMMFGGLLALTGCTARKNSSYAVTYSA